MRGTRHRRDPRLVFMRNPKKQNKKPVNSTRALVGFHKNEKTTQTVQLNEIYVVLDVAYVYGLPAAVVVYTTLGYTHFI